MSEYLFHWKARRVSLPTGHRQISQSATNYSLVCNGCGVCVISGTPYNEPGRRYFTHYAREAAEEHVETCNVSRKAGASPAPP